MYVYIYIYKEREREREILAAVHLALEGLVATEPLEAEVDAEEVLCNLRRAII